MAGAAWKSIKARKQHGTIGCVIRLSGIPVIRILLSQDCLMCSQASPLYHLAAKFFPDVIYGPVEFSLSLFIEAKGKEVHLGIL